MTDEAVLQKIEAQDIKQIPEDEDVATVNNTVIQNDEVAQDEPVNTSKKPLSQLEYKLSLEPVKEALKKIISDVNEMMAEAPNAVLPMEGHTGTNLRNLISLISSKQELIKKSFGLYHDIVEEPFVIELNDSIISTLDDFSRFLGGMGYQGYSGLDFNFTDGTITFKFYNGDTEEKQQTYKQFVEALNNAAKTLRHVAWKEKPTDNEKFTFLTWLVRLGLNGDDYKFARKFMFEKLSGNSALR